jgi:hypothetical protein
MAGVIVGHNYRVQNYSPSKNNIALAIKGGRVIDVGEKMFLISGAR